MATRTPKWTAAQLDLAAALMDSVDKLGPGWDRVEIRRDWTGTLQVSGPLSTPLRQRLEDAYEVESEPETAR